MEENPKETWDVWVSCVDEESSNFGSGPKFIGQFSSEHEAREEAELINRSPAYGEVAWVEKTA